MASNFDQFPIYDVLIKPRSIQMSDVWVQSISTFYQNLTGYLSQFGIFIPTITTDQRDTIQMPQNGQMIYNTTTNQFEGYKNGSWVTFTTT